MTSDGQHNFLGIPIEGAIHYHRELKTQRTREEFAQIVQAILDDETIVDFGWRQYTPYFNDGDECVFGAYGLWVRAREIVVPKPEERPWEERFIQAVANKLPYVYVLTVDKVLRMIAEALKEVPLPEVAAVCQERETRIAAAFREQLAGGETVASYHAFSALELVLKTLDEPEPQVEEVFDDDFDPNDYSFEDGGRLFNLGEIEYDGWGDLGEGSRGRLNERYVGPDEARYRRVETLNGAIDHGEFDHVLLELFGDHASVHVRRTGITVDEYSHD